LTRNPPRLAGFGVSGTVLPLPPETARDGSRLARTCAQVARVTLALSSALKHRGADDPGALLGSSVFGLAACRPFKWIPARTWRYSSRTLASSASRSCAQTPPNGPPDG